MVARLSLASAVGVRTGSGVSVAAQVQAGLPFRTLEQFQRRTGLPIDALTRAIRLPPRTLARRRTAKRLSVAESDRLARLVQIYDHALRFFDGNVEATTRWFKTPCLALSDKPPLRVVETEVGAHEVDQVIGRLEYGVFM
jgi:putative toxin-antitoxin system antitoxin component (TIGR02293 family)